MYYTLYAVLRNLEFNTKHFRVYKTLVTNFSLRHRQKSGVIRKLKTPDPALLMPSLTQLSSCTLSNVVLNGIKASQHETKEAVIKASYLLSSELGKVQIK